MKPWHQVVTPRKDLREGKPLDASEFAIHLQQVVSGTAPSDYREPARFFERTFITRGLREVAAEVLRRLSGESVSASPVINLTTQFGGGKTHALVLLYHLFSAGPEAATWPGVAEIVKDSGAGSVPKARIATFVGSEFDPVSGSGRRGEPTRMTPWGELAWQLGGQTAFSIVAEQDRLRIRPGGETIRAILPVDQPVLILMDEVLNFLNAARAIKAGDADGRTSTLASQFLSFLQALTEEASGRTGVVLVMALPKSEQEMTAEDEADFARLSKLATRVDKPYILSEGLETAEIIRRRLFEDLGSSNDRAAVTRAYVKSLSENRELLPQWFPIERTRELFDASYPFHPTVLSVFERKWQTLPRFQRTRGILRMLALWVSQTYLGAYQGGRRDPLITEGIAPLEDAYLRAAVLEQLGDNRLEATISADIAGGQAHAVRLDLSSPPAIQALRLHRAVAAAVFFESSGGQVREEATLPEIRLALGGPGLELGHIETALNALADECYYLTVEGARYRFSLQANLNKVISDVRAGLDEPSVLKRVQDEVQAVFKASGVLERRFFPERSSDLPNTAALTLVILRPEEASTGSERTRTIGLVRSLLEDAGSTSRTFKSSLFFALAESPDLMKESARRVLAWETLKGQSDERGLDESQRRQLEEQLLKARRDLREAVWQTYHTIEYLAPDGSVEELDLGLLHSSAGETLPGFIELRLRQQDILVDSVSPDFLVRHWPPALPQWPLQSLRDAFFSSPKLPRLINPGSLRSTIARGIAEGTFGLAALDSTGSVTRIHFRDDVVEADIAFSDEFVLVTKEWAQAAQTSPAIALSSSVDEADRSGHIESPGTERVVVAQARIRALRWSGVVDPSKLALFHAKVLSKLMPSGSVTVRLEVTAQPDAGLSAGQVTDVRQGLSDLGLGAPDLQNDDEPPRDSSP